MAISTEGKIGIALALAFGLGGGAVAVWPDQKIIGLAMMAFAALGLIALAIYHLWGPRPDRLAAPPPHSTTATAKGRGKISLENVYSTADKFADAEEEGTISAKHSVHNPSRPSGRNRD
jgi:hypothetical protein